MQRIVMSFQADDVVGSYVLVSPLLEFGLEAATKRLDTSILNDAPVAEPKWVPAP